MTGQPIVVTANVNWNASGNQHFPWIHLTGITNHSGNATIIYRIEANDGDDRNGIIYVSGAGLFRQFHINQAGSAAPQVLLRPSAGGQAHIAWPTSHTGYVVQWHPTLTSGPWVNQAGSPVVVGHEHQHTIAPTNDARFYRLHKP